MFQFSGLAPFFNGVGPSTDGFPHSEICGSFPFVESPQLFADIHVLLRLSEPRHPPCALFSFISVQLLGLLSHLKYVNDLLV